MEIIELNTDNISEYKDILDRDVSESIGREFYRGLVALGDNDSIATGALIWEYKNLEEDADTDAEICYVSSKTSETIKALLSEFDEQISFEKVCNTFFELGNLSGDESQSFTGEGFKLSTKESRDIVVTVSELKGLASQKKVSPKVVLLDEIADIQFMQGVTNCLFHGKKGILEDLEFIEKSWFDESVSCCVITDKKVSGLLLVHRFPSGNLMPMLLTAMGPDSKVDLLSMIIFSARKAVENYPSDTRVIIRRHNEYVKALAGKLFAGKSGSDSVQGERRKSHGIF